MGLTGMNYGFFARFYHEQIFVGKNKAYPLWIFSRNSIFFKTPKNLCTLLKQLTET
jgi:hypothetical protein